MTAGKIAIPMPAILDPNILNLSNHERCLSWSGSSRPWIVVTESTMIEWFVRMDVNCS